MNSRALAISILVSGSALAAPLTGPSAPPTFVGAPPDLTVRPAIGPVPAWLAPTASALTAGGVRVVALAQHHVPLVHVLVTVQAGSELDPAAEPGLASLTARMLEEGGAGTLSGAQLEQALDDLGGELMVDVDEAGARFAVTVLSTKLDRALGLIADMVARPRFDAKEWPSVRARQVADLEHERDKPRRVADAVFQRVLYGDQPYGHRPLGTPSSLAKISLDDVKAFYQQHYGPRVTSVVLVGDVAPEKATLPVQAAFAKALWSPSVTPPPVPPAPAAGVARFVLVDRPGAPQSEVRVGRLGVSWSHPDLASVSLLETVLGGSFTSRLNQNLREKHAYTYGAHARFDLLRAPGPFVASAAIRTDATAEALKEFFHELTGMQAPLADGELRKGRALVLQHMVDEFGEGPQAAALLGELVLNDQPLDVFGRLQAKLRALDVPAVTKVADKLFPSEAWIVVIVGDRKAIEPKLRPLPMAKTIELRDVDGEILK